MSDTAKPIPAEVQIEVLRAKCVALKELLARANEELANASADRFYYAKSAKVLMKMLRKSEAQRLALLKKVDELGGRVASAIAAANVDIEGNSK